MKRSTIMIFLGAVVVLSFIGCQSFTANRANKAVKATNVNLKAGNAEFNGTAAEEEGYWYSRYNLGNLVMRSEMGEAFMPEKSMVKAMVKMADADPADGDTAVPPTNAALLSTVYASGDPHYITKFNPADYKTQRWDAATFDTTVTSQALGWTIIKETEWGKQFHVDEHFGKPQDDFGAQWRFAGLVLVA